MAKYKINNCPLCGGEMKIQEVKESDYAMKYSYRKLQCQSCPLDYGRLWYTTKHDLISKWNKDTKTASAGAAKQRSNKTTREEVYDKSQS